MSTTTLDISKPAGAKIIDGRDVAKKMRVEQKERVDALEVATGVIPGLAVILVGEDPASALYAAKRAGRNQCRSAN